MQTSQIFVHSNAPELKLQATDCIIHGTLKSLHADRCWLHGCQQSAGQDDKITESYISTSKIVGAAINRSLLYQTALHSTQVLQCYVMDSEISVAVLNSCLVRCHILETAQLTNCVLQNCVVCEGSQLNNCEVEHSLFLEELPSNNQYTHCASLGSTPSMIFQTGTQWEISSSTLVQLTNAETGSRSLEFQGFRTKADLTVSGQVFGWQVSHTTTVRKSHTVNVSWEPQRERMNLEYILQNTFSIFARGRAWLGTYSEPAIPGIQILLQVLNTGYTVLLQQQRFDILSTNDIKYLNQLQPSAEGNNEILSEEALNELFTRCTQLFPTLRF